MIYIYIYTYTCYSHVGTIPMTNPDSHVIPTLSYKFLGMRANRRSRPSEGQLTHYMHCQAIDPSRTRSDPLGPVRPRKRGNILDVRTHTAYPYPPKPVPVQKSFKTRSKGVHYPFATRSLGVKMLPFGGPKNTKIMSQNKG